MKLVITIANLKKEIEDVLKQSTANYQRAQAIYLVKLKAYVGYVEKQLRAEKALTKPAPYLQKWDRSNLLNTLNSLKLHQGTSIEIDDRELTDLKQGIQRLRHVAEETISALSAISY